VGHVEVERLLAGEQERDFPQQVVELWSRPTLAPVRERAGGRPGSVGAASPRPGRAAGARTG
jgi:hypothetical protein